LGDDFDMYRADQDDDDDDDDDDNNNFVTQGVATQNFLKSQDSDVWGESGQFEVVIVIWITYFGLGYIF
jgi:hypothetical protein